MDISLEHVLMLLGAKDVEIFKLQTEITQLKEQIKVLQAPPPAEQ